MLPSPVVSSAVTVTPGSLGGDQENRRAGIGFGRHQEGVGHRAVGDLGAGSGQPVAVAGLVGLHRARRPSRRPGRR